MTETPPLTVSAVIELLSHKHLVELYKILKTKNLDVYPEGYKSTGERLKELEDKYFDLVWFARKSAEHYLIPGVKKAWDRIVSSYPKEVGDLIDPEMSDWSHGFNSGMLACVRLLRPYLLDVDWHVELSDDDESWVLTREILVNEADEEFPLLDT